MAEVPLVCPVCGHHTSQAVGGVCTVFVPGTDPDGPPAEFCGCDCYKAATGRTMLDAFAEAMWGSASTTEE